MIVDAVERLSHCLAFRCSLVVTIMQISFSSNKKRLKPSSTCKTFQQLLDGIDSPTPLPLNFKGLQRSYEISVVQQTINDASYAQVRSGVLDAEVNEETLAQLAWAVVLGRYGAKGDVGFGGSSSARDEAFSDLSNVSGLCRVPVLVQVDPDQTVRDSLRALNVRQSAMVLSLIHI